MERCVYSQKSVHFLLISLLYWFIKFIFWHWSNMHSRGEVLTTASDADTSDKILMTITSSWWLTDSFMCCCLNIRYVTHAWKLVGLLPFEPSKVVSPPPGIFVHACILSSTNQEACYFSGLQEPWTRDYLYLKDSWRPWHCETCLRLQRGQGSLLSLRQEPKTNCMS